MTKRADLEPLIIQEWLQRNDDKRSKDDIFEFYLYLQQEKPFLLEFRSGAKKDQLLKSILRNHIKS
jgi:hypothetical protein